MQNRYTALRGTIATFGVLVGQSSQIVCVCFVGHANVFSLLVAFISSFGCVGSWLHHVGSFLVACGLSTCGAPALQLPCEDLVAVWHVGS